MHIKENEDIEIIVRRNHNVLPPVSFAIVSILSCTPLIVNVFPLPVCPYANAVAAYPLSALSNNPLIPQPLKNCCCVVVGPGNKQHK